MNHFYKIIIERKFRMITSFSKYTKWCENLNILKDDILKKVKEFDLKNTINNIHEEGSGQQYGWIRFTKEGWNSQYI